MSHAQNLQIIQPSNPLEVLTLIDAQSYERFAHQIAFMVKEGHAGAVQSRVSMNFWKKAFALAEKLIEEETERDAERYGKTFEFMGAKCEWGATYTAYDYESTGDDQWAEHKRAELTVAGKRKEREAFLRTLKAPIDIVSRETGEVITIIPPIKTQTEGLKITIK